MADAAVTNAVPGTDDVTDAVLEALAPVLERLRDSQARREHLALLKAVRLSPDLETCEAILRGERVPRSRLDALWAKAYGR